jgi:hypothetical protein
VRLQPKCGDETQKGNISMPIWIQKLHYEMMQYVKAYLFTSKCFSNFSKQYELSLNSK